MRTIGHDAVKMRFERTLARGRLASTYLFVGPEGVGKRVFALDLAERLLCQAPPDPSKIGACGRCESCRQTQAGGHPDLIRVEKPADKSTLPMELFVGRPERRHREGLCHDIALKPYLSSRRVAVIDDADDLGVESANALLKTLEEPPPRSVLILLGTSLSKQLPTIRSRSQIVRFGALTTDEIAQALVNEGLLEDGEPAEALAGSAAGSVSRALESREDDQSTFRRQFVDAIAQADFDPIRLAAMIQEHLQAGGAEPAARRRRLRMLLGGAIEHDRYRLRAAAASCGPTDALLRRLDCSLLASGAVDRNANQATLVQSWLTELAGLPSD